MTLRIPDISHWKGGINVNTVLAKSDGLIIKATESTNFKDSYFDTWAKKIVASKKPFGFYHFFRGHGVAEANWFYKNCKSYFKKGIPILDVEVACSKASVQAFIDRIHALTGIWCVVYASASFIGSYVNDYVKKHCGIWVAGYPSPAPTTWTTRAFPYKGYTKGCTVVGWQFTDKLNMAGKAVDASIFYLTKERWTEYALAAKKGSVSSSTKTNTTSSNKTTKPSVTPISSKSTLTLVYETMLGDYGTGATRKKELGSRYDEVMKVINHISRSGVNTLAKETIAGKYGDGNVRKTILGAKYAEVQKKVNELM